MSHIKIDLQLVHDRLGRLTHEMNTIARHLVVEHPDLYKDVASDLDGIRSCVYYMRNAIFRYNHSITFKSFYK